MHTVELLPSAEPASSVRELWAQLHDAGLPSLATHTSLALRVPPSSQAAALELLTAVPPMSVSFVAARTYDTESRTAGPLGAVRG